MTFRGDSLRDNSFLKPDGDRLKVYVLIKPSSRRTEVKGVRDERLEVALTAPAKENKANEQLISFLSDSLDVPKSAISVLLGHHARKKTVGIGPVSDPQRVARKLGELADRWSLGGLPG